VWNGKIFVYYRKTSRVSRKFHESMTVLKIKCKNSSYRNKILLFNIQDSQNLLSWNSLQQIVKLSVQNEPEKFHEMGEPKTSWNFHFHIVWSMYDNYPSNTVCFIRNEISFRILITCVYYKLRRLQTVSQFSLHFFPDFFWDVCQEADWWVTCWYRHYSVLGRIHLCSLETVIFYFEDRLYF
jgi:hypothetical protein